MRSKNSAVPVSASVNFVPHGCACQNARTRSLYSELSSRGFGLGYDMDQWQAIDSEYKLKVLSFQAARLALRGYSPDVLECAGQYEATTALWMLPGVPPLGGITA